MRQRTVAQDQGRMPMSKLIIKGTTREGCQVTIIDRTTPHDNQVHHEIIMETVSNVVPIELNTLEWENE